MKWRCGVHDMYCALNITKICLIIFVFLSNSLTLRYKTGWIGLTFATLHLFVLDIFFNEEKNAID